MLHFKKNQVCFSVTNPGAYLDFIYHQGVHFLASFSAKGKNLRGREHLCLPVFGEPHKHSDLRGKMPKHGAFREKDHELLKRQSGIHIPFTLAPEPEDAYIWPLVGYVRYVGKENELRTEIKIWRDADGVGGLAPINIADHPYWKRWGDVEITMGDFQHIVYSHVTIPEALKIPYTGKVTVQITETVKVELEIEGNQLKDPQLILWTDALGYLCAELAMTNPKLFDTPEGAFVEEEEEPVEVVFTKRFFVED